MSRRLTIRDDRGVGSATGDSRVEGRVVGSATFSDARAAWSAVRGLRQGGFPGEPGGLNPDSSLASKATGNSDVQEPMKNSTGAGGSAAVGAGLGSIAGLLVGLAGLAIPGVGPIIAAGPLAAALGGLVAGGA